MGKVSLVNFNIKNIPAYANKSVSELSYMDGLLIVAISRDGQIIVPHGGTILKENDIIYVIGQKNKIESIAKNLQEPIGNKAIKKVMILGGGKIGYYLAERLSKKILASRL
ncbi:MAG: hypothetical protein JJE29_04210 [Peptostreptococcaceae bacterium]|nr:hypothetical protein [Peptostreptococcaceae bacterium]